jgi:RHS repeat-associated protein
VGGTATSASVNVVVSLAGETITYLHNDFAGSAIAATDVSGAVVWKESYQPYGGKVRNEAGASGNRQFFTGKPYDADSGLSYMGARYYDPVIGRFMGVDAVGYSEGNLQSFNRFGYANNNPFRFVDPDGNAPITMQQLQQADAAIGAYQQCGAASNCASAALAGMVRTRDDLRAAGVDAKDRMPISNNIAGEQLRIGDFRPAMDASAGLGILLLQNGASKGAAPPNLSPAGAGRSGAFNEAKRQSGVPTSQQPSRVLPNEDKRGNAQPGRIYEYEVGAPNGGTRTVRIRDDAGGHNHGPNNPQNRGSHFNDAKGNHYDY